jgi:hypothetical protein
VDRPVRLAHYELLEEIGAGEFGTVHRARHPGLDRVVAVKVLKRPAGAAVERFVREAEVLGQVNHQAVVRVYDSGRSEDGRWYLVSEHIGGPNLKSWLEEHRVCPPRVAAAWVARLADGLAVAHAREILHRDVKPSNIMMRPTVEGDSAGAEDYEPVLIDFGLARRRDRPLDMTRHAVGSPLYMAPEQFRGEVDERSDEWGLGVVLYELLTGRVPFEGASELDVQRQIVEIAPPPPRQLNQKVPTDLETICLKAIRKEPSARYADTRALADDLRNWLERRPIRARPVGTLERAWMWSRRNRVLALVLGLAAGLGLGLVVTLLWVGLRLAADYREIGNLYYEIGRQEIGSGQHLSGVYKLTEALQWAHDSGDASLGDRIALDLDLGEQALPQRVGERLTGGRVHELAWGNRRNRGWWRRWIRRERSGSSTGVAAVRWGRPPRSLWSLRPVGGSTNWPCRRTARLWRLAWRMGGSRFARPARPLPGASLVRESGAQRGWRSAPMDRNW